MYVLSDLRLLANIIADPDFRGTVTPNTVMQNYNKGYNAVRHALRLGVLMGVVTEDSQVLHFKMLEPMTMLEKVVEFTNKYNMDNQAFAFTEWTINIYAEEQQKVVVHNARFRLVTLGDELDKALRDMSAILLRVALA